MPNKPKFKYGSFSQYNALPSKDDNTLYFITDRGLVFKGTHEVTKHITITDHVNGAGIEDNDKYIIITDNSTNPSSTPSTFYIYNTTAVNTLLSTHAALVGSGSVQGHVYLSDATDSELAAASGGTAATPKAVKDAITAAKGYTDTAIGTAISGLAGAMIFKGVIGTADAYSSSSTYAIGDLCIQDDKLYQCTTAISTQEEFNTDHWVLITDTVSLPTNGYKKGWTYKCCTAGTFAGKNCEIGDMIIAVNDGPNSGDTVIDEDWSVVQSNIDGAVYSNETLTADAVILGNGTTQVKKLTTGSDGKYLKVGNGAPSWGDIFNEENGFALMLSNDAPTTSGNTKTYSVTAPLGYALKTGGIFGVRFANTALSGVSAVNGSVILSIGIDGRSLSLVVREKGSGEVSSYRTNETVVFMINKETSNNVTTYYADILASNENITKLSQLGIDTGGLASCSGNTTTLNATLSGFVLANNAVVSVRFSNAVQASSTLNIESTGAKSIYHRGIAIKANVIDAGDTATFVYDGSYYHLLAIDKEIEKSAPTQNSNKLITSGVVYDYTCWWETL